MIERERWDALQEMIVRSIHARPAGLTARSPESREKYKARVFRIFDPNPELKLVGDGQAKLRLGFVLYLDTGAAIIEGVVDQTRGYALAFDELEAAYRNHRGVIGLDLEFCDPFKGGDRRKTQQKIVYEVHGVQCIDGDIQKIAEQIADHIELFYKAVKEINALARPEAV